MFETVVERNINILMLHAKEAGIEREKEYKKNTFFYLSRPSLRNETFFVLLTDFYWTIFFVIGYFIYTLRIFYALYHSSIYSKWQLSNAI
jgi:hypothetical protein